jgi:hypothetical protein
MTVRIRVGFARVALLSVAVLICLFPRAAAGQDAAVFTNVLDFNGHEFTHMTFDPGDEHSASGILSKYSSLAAFTIAGGSAAVRHYTAYATNFFGDDGTEGGAVTGEYRIDWGYFGNSLVTATFVEPVDAVGAFFGGVVWGSAGAALTVVLTDGRIVGARVADYLAGVVDGASFCVAINGFLGIDSNGGPRIVQAQFSNAHDAASLDSLLFGTAFGGSTGPGPTGFARVPYVEACGQSPIPLPEPLGIANLIELIRSLGLNPGIENSLIVKLQNAMEALDAGNVETACSLVNSFIQEAQAQSGKEIQPDASQLISAAYEIRATLGCS